MRNTVLALCLSTAACHDDALETLALDRCETLLAAQELASLPPPLRKDPRAAIRPKDSPRISDRDATVFIRRAYDRLTDGKGTPRIEARDYTCVFDKKTNAVATLSTNGHQQELRLNDAEWAIMRNSTQ